MSTTPFRSGLSPFPETALTGRRPDAGWKLLCVFLPGFPGY